MSQIFNPLHNKTVFGNRHGDAGGIHLLEAIPPEERSVHIAGDKHNRDRIHKGGSDARDQVGGARAGGGEANARFPAGARIALGCMCRPLLMRSQDVADFITVVIERVIHCQDCSARIPKNRIHSLLQQHIHDDLRARSLHANHPCFLSLPMYIAPPVFAKEVKTKNAFLFP